MEERLSFLKDAICVSSIFMAQSKIINCMKPDSVRTTVDIPTPLYRKLKQLAAARGNSVRELVVAGIKTVLNEPLRQRSRRVKFPLIVSEGPKVNLTNEQIYDQIEFP